jgi:16S rRNA A1518/A1519 N6-dimethyltransferase RsmA/KsgA/DIM1 with predicted DNA glycosylase/AP lyase activity
MPALSLFAEFLTSGKTIGRLLRLTDIGPGDHVLEIGPEKAILPKRFPNGRIR